MNLVLLGFGVGIVAVGVPGPVSLSLVQVATAQGRASGTKAAVGIVSGDIILSILGVCIVTAGSAVPVAAFETFQYLSALLIVSFGLLMIGRPGAVQAKAGLVSRPYRTFLMLTTFVPSTLGSWLALLVAMPFASNRPSLAAFALGVVSVSVVWHLFLGYSAGYFGQRLTSSVLVAATRIGGAATVALGLWALT